MIVIESIADQDDGPAGFFLYFAAVVLAPVGGTVLATLLLETLVMALKGIAE